MHCEYTSHLITAGKIHRADNRCKPTGQYGPCARKCVTIASSSDVENDKGEAKVAIPVHEETIVTPEHSYCHQPDKLTKESVDELKECNSVENSSGLGLAHLGSLTTDNTTFGTADTHAETVSVHDYLLDILDFSDTLDPTANLSPDYASYRGSSPHLQEVT